MSAHRFRTLLATIVSSIDLLRFHAPRLSAAERDELLREISNAADGMVQMLEELRP